MEESLVLKAEKREKRGTRSARAERKQGKVPAIIYGHKQEPISAVLNHHDLTQAIRHHHRLLDIELEGKTQKCLIKDVQFDYLGDTIIHVDFARVNIDERVEVEVELALKGTPVGVHDGGALDQLLTTVSLECTVSSIPESIRVNISDLKLGETINAGDLELPTGVKLLTPPDVSVVTVRVPTEEAAEEEAEAASAEEPEVITKEKAEEEGES